MKKGILLIAIGHENYLWMAANLAAGIKYNDDKMPIALATAVPPPIWFMEKKLVDMIIHVPQEYYTTDGKTEFIKAKTHMYDLSPFDKTIFLDVDMGWLNYRKPADLFDQLKELDFTMANTGEAGDSSWCDIAEVKKVYKTDNKFYNFHSEFVYFKKCAAVKKYFDKVKEIYARPKLKTLTSFGGARLADELAFQIASMVLNYYPHKDDFLPTFWWGRNNRPGELNQYLYQLDKSYYSYSIGGKFTPAIVAKNYNTLASFYFQKMKIANKPWFAKDKKTFIPERKNI